jgi:hypothetical protein
MRRQDPTGSTSSAKPRTVAPAEDSQPRGYFIGGCGHPVPIGPNCRVGECRVCDASRLPVSDLRLPAAELYTINAVTSVDTVSWWCRLCDHEATVASAPAADTAAVEHLTACHHATVAT